MTAFLASLRPWRQSYDWIGIVYVLLTGLLPFLNPDCFQQVSNPGPLHALWPHLGFHLALALVLFLAPPLLRSRPQWPLRLLGVIYLPLMMPLFYAELEFLGVLFFPYGQSFDPQLIALEQWIFGFQPSLEWSRAWPWPWLLELMQFAYFSYYFFGLITLILIWTAARRSPGRNWALSAALTRDLSAVMLSCYVWFIAFPVWGPKYFEFLGLAGPVASEGLRGWIFTDIMGWVHANGALHGAAFPSSHVAGSLACWWWGWRLAHRHRWWYTALWGLLSLSIVYCRYHYVVDLVAGIAWGALVLWVTHRLLPMPADGLRRPPLSSVPPVSNVPQGTSGQAPLPGVPASPAPAPVSAAGADRDPGEAPTGTTHAVAAPPPGNTSASKAPAGWRAQAANAMDPRGSRPRRV